MGRSKQKPRRGAKAAAMSALSAQQPAPAPAPRLSIQDLLVNSARLIASLDYEGAKKLCLEACERANEEVQQQTGDPRLLRDALEILGTVELELGQVEEARDHFVASIQLATALPDPSPAPHLYLAQLSSTPQESLEHFSNALVIFQAKLQQIEKVKLGGDGSAGSQDDLEDEGELRRSASRALVGMTELYLTDLCFEEDAEQKCEDYLRQASELDPTDPEVYQTLASVRLSQQRDNDAKEAAERGYSLWKNLENNSPLYPPPSARLSCAKLLLELSQHVPALEILQTLEGEDDEDSETWYLSGWAWYLLGEARGANASSTNEEESREECWSEAKLCLENYLKIEEREPESTDPEQMQHVEEVLQKLNEAGIVASQGAAGEGYAVGHNGGDEWEDASDAEMED
ncbi:Acl4p [Sporobolomyces koalae]|uniref:Acl4p n=1 Tax=Sporobolomyces koalae TaxID=500713 RepID=UPI0031796C87